jgi:hypothetical protein
MKYDMTPKPSTSSRPHFFTTPIPLPTLCLLDQSESESYSLLLTGEQAFRRVTRCLNRLMSARTSSWSFSNTSNEFLAQWYIQMIPLSFQSDIRPSSQRHMLRKTIFPSGNSSISRTKALKLWFQWLGIESLSLEANSKVNWTLTLRFVAAYANLSSALTGSRRRNVQDKNSWL